MSTLGCSTFKKSNEICLQAFAARLLLLRHGFSCQAIFSEPQIIRPTFSKTPNSQLSARNFWTEMNSWGHRNMRPQIISTTLNFKPPESKFGGLKFQTSNNVMYLKFQTQNKHMSSLSSQSWCPLPPPPPLRPSQGLGYPANQLSVSPCLR